MEGGGGGDMSSNSLEPPHYDFPSYGPAAMQPMQYKHELRFPFFNNYLHYIGIGSRGARGVVAPLDFGLTEDRS